MVRSVRRGAGRRRARLILVGICCGLLAALWHGAAAAHPLGNFSVSTYSRLDFAGERVRVTYVVDHAEIPTFQLLQGGRLDPNGDGRLDSAEAAAFIAAEGPRLRDGLRLTIGGRATPLRLDEGTATLLPGQAELTTLRVELHLSAALPPDWATGGGAVQYADDNYRERIGWREILARGGPGVVVAGITSDDRSDELRTYPQDRLDDPLARREVAFSIAAGEGGAAGGTAARAAGGVAAGQAGRDSAASQVAALLGVTAPTPAVLLAAIVGAIFWGAAHALSPGHGKAVVAAYLIGARGTAKHAAFLGLTVTLTHTAGVFALGGITLWLSASLLPERLYPWLNAASGLLVVLIGLSLAVQRLRGGSARTDHDHAPGDFAAAPDGTNWGALTHSHGGRAHSHLPPGAAGARPTWRSLLTLGVSGGLIPCPSALVLLLSAISLGRAGLGLVLVLAFSAGLALVLTAIGIVCVYARRVFARYSFEPRLPRFLPVASALAITLAGGLIIVDALRQAGLV